MPDILTSDKTSSVLTPRGPFAWNDRPDNAALPAPLTSFVGREREIGIATRWLLQPDIRLLTLTGMGGIGKTRLALQIASCLKDAFAHGVGFVSLASVHDPHLVPASVAKALSLPDAPDQPLLMKLQGSLAHRNTLLVFDNFEHLLEAAPLVHDLLATCPHLKFLCTSRTRLNVSGEHVFTVPPLTLSHPDGLSGEKDPFQIEAVQLFIERATAHSSEFACTLQDVEEVIGICRRLDGLPLSIELAAAKISVLPLRALLPRLEHRLTLLSDGPRDAPTRQRTMRDSIAWSHDLLTPCEQRLYRRLAVFTGGCSLEAAESVTCQPNGTASEVFDGIASLVRHNLLRLEEGADATPRYSMLETVREDALERLVACGEEEDLRRRQARYILALSESRQSGVPEQAWLVQMEPEHDNVRAVLTWAIERGEIALAQRLIAAIWLHLWAIRGHFREGRMWAERTRQLGPGLSPDMYEEVLFAASEFAVACGDLDHAVTLAREAVAGAQASGNNSRVGMALHHLAKIIGQRDGMDRAEPMIEQARALLDGVEGFRERRTAAAATHNLAVAVGRRGDGERAKALALEALMSWQKLSSNWGTAGTLMTLAGIASEQGDAARAITLGQEALTVCKDLRSGVMMVDALRMAVGFCPSDRGHAELMARLWGAADALTKDLGLVTPHEDQIALDDCLTRVRSALGPDTFDTEWAAGQTQPLTQIIIEALAYVPASQSVELPRVNERARQHALTPREVEILWYLAERRTDQEIADVLFLSRRTINAHVRHILSKLGAPTRRVAVSRAQELELLPIEKKSATYT